MKKSYRVLVLGLLLAGTAIVLAVGASVGDHVCRKTKDGWYFSGGVSHWHVGATKLFTAHSIPSSLTKKSFYRDSTVVTAFQLLPGKRVYQTTLMRHGMPVEVRALYSIQDDLVIYGRYQEKAGITHWKYVVTIVDRSGGLTSQYDLASELQPACLSGEELLCSEVDRTLPPGKYLPETTLRILNVRNGAEIARKTLPPLVCNMISGKAREIFVLRRSEDWPQFIADRKNKSAGSYVEKYQMDSWHLMWSRKVMPNRGVPSRISIYEDLVYLAVQERQPDSAQAAEFWDFAFDCATGDEVTAPRGFDPLLCEVHVGGKTLRVIKKASGMEVREVSIP